MAQYKISSLKTTDEEGKGTAESPFKLDSDADWEWSEDEQEWIPTPKGGTEKVTEINLKDCYVKMGRALHYKNDDWGEYDFNTFFDNYEWASLMPNLTKVEGGHITNTDGSYMFCECTALTTFTSDLSNLANGSGIFYGCSSLQSVKIKCTEANKYLMTKAKLYIRSEATLEVSTDNGQSWETITT